jgi:hypothetical protein|tara:strand:+ start:17747 stop:18322 length:576 start_codon:yes stop_codon:yes gene_type:complete
MPIFFDWRIDHLATRIWALLGIILLIFTATASPLQPDQVSANGATRLIINDAQEGPYLFRVGILPGSPKVGNLHLSVLIQSADGDQIISDGQMIIQATGPELGMTAGPVQATNAPLNPQVFDADITLTALGTWTITLETVSELGEATLVVPLQVTEAGGFNLLIVLVIAVIVVAIAALVWSQKQRKQPSRK